MHLDIAAVLFQKKLQTCESNAFSAFACFRYTTFLTDFLTVVSIAVSICVPFLKA